MKYFYPESIKDALEMKAAVPEGIFIAGGTDLCVIFSDTSIVDKTLIDLTRIASLKGIKKGDGKLKIGACTKIADIAESVDVPTALAQGAFSIGSPQIRNSATIGGNICNGSPCGDTLPPLLVLSARFVLESSSGKREIPSAEFFIGPKKTILREDEILTHIIIDEVMEKGASAFKMFGKRNGQVISQVNGALWILLNNNTIDDIRISFGSVAPVPVRAEKTELFLQGKSLKKDLARSCRDYLKDDLKPITDVRASEKYRYILAETILNDTFNNAANMGDCGNED